MSEDKPDKKADKDALAMSKLLERPKIKEKEETD